MKKPNINDTIKSADLPALRGLWLDYRKAAELAKGMQAMVEDEIRERHTEFMRDSLRERGREHGECTIFAEGAKVHMEVRASVKWDQEKMRRVAQQMTPEQQQKLIKVELSIPERLYGVLLDGELKSIIDEARTVTYSEPKVSFAHDE